MPYTASSFAHTFNIISPDRGDGIRRYTLSLKAWLLSKPVTPPFPQTHIIGAMVIVWRVGRKIIRSVLCNIVRNNCTQCNAHTWTDIRVLWMGFVSLGPFHCAYIHFCICMYFLYDSILHACVVLWHGEVAWWDWSLSVGLLLTSVLCHCRLGHLTCKNPSPIWPIMCLVGR